MTDDDLPRFVYHGTDAASADAILEEGLQPREETNQSNWADKEVPSIPGHVYLTRQHALHFADAARDDDDPIAIVEVDLDLLDTDHALYPDEDFVEQALRGGPQSAGLGDHIEVPEFADIDLSGDMRERTAKIRDHIELFRGYWKVSLLTMGNVSHRGAVPPEAISRVSIVDLPSAFRVSVLGDGPSLVGSALDADKNEVLTKWVMGEDVSGEELARVSLHGVDELPPGIGDQFQQMLDDASRDVRENKQYQTA